METIVSNFRGKKVLVVGDVMLDHYIFGEVNRVSPEGPYLILKEDHREFRPGGAANVATMLRALGCDVTLFGVAGKDQASVQLSKILEGLKHSFFAVDTFTTTTKTRLCTKHPVRAQIMRVDNEKYFDCYYLYKHSIYYDEVVRKTDWDCVFVSDYGKGFVSGNLIWDILQRNKRVFVDPKQHISKYIGVEGITPNHKEYLDYIIDKEEYKDVCYETIKKYKIKSMMLKQGDKGVMSVSEDGVFPVGSKNIDVVDVCGAGDISFAVYGLACVSGATYLQASTLANIAGGIEVRKFGVSPVFPDEILSEIEN